MNSKLYINKEEHREALYETQVELKKLFCDQLSALKTEFFELLSGRAINGRCKLFRDLFKMMMLKHWWRRMPNLFSNF